MPKWIRSDRGTHFIGANKEQFMIDEVKLIDKRTKHGVEWVFNTTVNPTADGAFILKENSPKLRHLIACE